jgi:glycosyltransferase involved in cell wall biosynthesis
LPYRNVLSSIYNDFFMRRLIAHDRLDVVHFPANYGFGPPGARTVVTLHDAINILPLTEILRGHRKDLGSMAMMSYLHYCTKAAVARADLILTVSQHAGREIARWGGCDPGEIVAIPHAPALDLQPIDDPFVLDEVRRRYDLSRPFVLADALKNPAVLLRAWRLLSNKVRQDREMIFFSRQPDPLPIVQEAVTAGEARLLVRPPRADLIALYSMAEAFIFPSWIEGFGLPVLEAMACGAPVIASDRGSIPEVAGDAALLADAENPEAVARHLGLVLGSPEEARRLRERGFARAAQFSWRKTGERILAAYEQIVAAA